MRTIAGALGGLIVSIPISWIMIVSALENVGLVLSLMAVIAVVLASAGSGAWIGRLRWASTRWKLDAVGLHARRGVLWRVEILVPRSRVQHLDLERGPLERHFGLATLVVHTAGSQNQAVRQSGLAEADAVALRAALVPESTQHGDAL